MAETTFRPKVTNYPGVKLTVPEHTINKHNSALSISKESR
jgi:hypothetical protein